MRQALVVDTAKVSVLTILSKIAGALKTIVIARYFGAAGVLDTYLLAFLPVSFVMDVLSGSMINALLPAFVEASERGGREDALALYGSVQARTFAMLVAIAAILTAAAHPLLHLLATGFDDEKVRLTATLMFIMIPILPLSALNVSWRALLNAEDSFGAAAISPALVPVFTVIALVTLTSRYGIYALAIGTITGAIAESVVLLFFVWASGAPVFFGFRGPIPGTRQVFAQYFPAAGGALVMTGSTFIEQSMAAMMGPGSVAILNFGTRLVTVLLAIGPAALSTVILPRLSRLRAKGGGQEVLRTIGRYGMLSLAVTVPLTLILILSSKWLVELILQRGAFTPADTASVARVQAFAFLRVPLSMLLALLLPMVASLKRNSMLLAAAVLTLAANLILSFVFMNIWGVAGLALTAAIVHLLTVLFLANRLLTNPAGAVRPGPFS